MSGCVLKECVLHCMVQIGIKNETQLDIQLIQQRSESEADSIYVTGVQSVACSGLPFHILSIFVQYPY